MDKYSIIEALNTIIDGIGYEEVSLMDVQHQLEDLVEDINDGIDGDWDGEFLNGFE